MIKKYKYSHSNLSLYGFDCPYCNEEDDYSDLIRNIAFDDKIEIECKGCGKKFAATSKVEFYIFKIKEVE